MKTMIVKTRHGTYRVEADSVTTGDYNSELKLTTTKDDETKGLIFKSWEYAHAEGYPFEEIVVDDEPMTRPEGEAGMLSQGIDFVEVKPIQLSGSDVLAIEVALNDSIVAKLVEQGYRIFKAQKGNVQLYKPLPESKPEPEDDLAELILGGLFMSASPGYPTGYGFHFPEGLVVADEQMTCILCGEAATDIVNTTGGNLSIGSADEAKAFCYCETCADEKHDAMAQERLDADLKAISEQIPVLNADVKIEVDEMTLVNTPELTGPDGELKSEPEEEPIPEAPKEEAELK